MSPDAALARTSPLATVSMAMSPEAVRMRTSAGADPIGHVTGARLDLEGRAAVGDGDVAGAGLHRRRPADRCRARRHPIR